MTERKMLLSNVAHDDLRVEPRYGAEFGDCVNQMLVFPTEFEDLQREYPILFRRDANGDFQSVVLLGLEKNENLFLHGTQWHARYIPAVQRRGPFSIALQRGTQSSDETNPVIHIDLNDARVGKEKGEALFKTHGGNSNFLDHITDILSILYEGLDRSPSMFSAFEEHELLHPVELDIKLTETEGYTITDMFAISEDRLSALDAGGLARLHETGFLRTAFLAAASLGNVARLIEMKNAKGARH